MSAYNETCASIGNIYWNYRLFLLHGDARFYDVLERTLYNGMVSGVSLSGDRFFYPNPLESLGQHSRSAWFGCACCPSNVCRFIPSVPGYVYAQQNDRIFANLFMSSTAEIMLSGTAVQIAQTTNYPWNGTVDFTLNPAKHKNFEMAIRIPGWAQNQPLPSDLYSFTKKDDTPFTLMVNGKPAAYRLENGYAVLKREWKKGDVIHLTLPMPVRQVAANTKVVADQNKIALQRGPIVYCAEWPEHSEGRVLNLVVNPETAFTASYRPDFLDGVTVIKAEVEQSKRTMDNQINVSKATFEAIPYYAWANRGPGEMAVWFGTKPSASRPLPAPTIASRSKLSASHVTKTLIALNDQAEPKNSNDHDNIYYHWWPMKDTLQWVQYTFDKPETISSTNVYWFDDGPWGGCRVPASWRLLYQNDAGEWKPVQTKGAFGIAKYQYN